MSIFFKITNYFKEVKTELKKVTWPSKSTIVNYTIAVVIFSLVMMVFLGGLDLLFSYLLNKFVL
jgi:preprotein translocase subunit SecE